MLAATLSRLINRLPSHCRVAHTWPANALCGDCVSLFAQPRPRCQTCALPLPLGMTQCGICLKQPAPLDKCLAALAYACPWSTLVADFKCSDQPGLARSFALMLRPAPWVEPGLDASDLLLPLPLSNAKLAQRGYNQALLLALELNKTKVRSDLLLRVQETPAQHTLKRAQRLSALEHAFAVGLLLAAQVQGKRLVLVDDVMTTGASLCAAAKVLRAAAASDITGLVLARTE